VGVSHTSLPAEFSSREFAGDVRSLRISSKHASAQCAITFVLLNINWPSFGYASRAKCRDLPRWTVSRLYRPQSLRRGGDVSLTQRYMSVAIGSAACEQGDDRLAGGAEEARSRCATEHISRLHSQYPCAYNRRNLNKVMRVMDRQCMDKNNVPLAEDLAKHHGHDTNLQTLGRS